MTDSTVDNRVKLLLTFCLQSSTKDYGYRRDIRSLSLGTVYIKYRFLISAVSTLSTLRMDLRLYELPGISATLCTCYCSIQIRGRGSIQVYGREILRWWVSKNILSFPATSKHWKPTVPREILPPIAKKQRGRPKTKRICKGAWKKKEIHCSNCGLLGNHNKRGCQNVPVAEASGKRKGLGTGSWPLLFLLLTLLISKTNERETLITLHPRVASESLLSKLKFWWPCDMLVSRNIFWVADIYSAI